VRGRRKLTTGAGKLNAVKTIAIGSLNDRTGKAGASIWPTICLLITKGVRRLRDGETVAVSKKGAKQTQGKGEVLEKRANTT